MFLKKTLGQHFLRDSRILGKIVEAANLAPDDTVLEVGPGEGTLTKLLLERAGKVVAVEKDERLIPFLQKKFSTEIASEKLNLIHADILKITPHPNSSTPDVEESSYNYKVVANLPYYITGKFLRRFLQETEHPPVSMTLLLQKQVAKRIVAVDGKESLLSISVKAYGTPRCIATVKAGSFSPPPKVDSAILAIERVSKKFFERICHTRESGYPEMQTGELDSRVRSPRKASGEAGGNDNKDAFFALLKRGFAHPRKLLASNLGVAPEALIACGIAPNARAENVSLENWGRLYLRTGAAHRHE